ncbi:PcfJ domain-containing protein [Massilia sp. DWR3-1-1]|uniref:PcfJ domain-containing protein n=1 Tax=Massilia sp. DWR3-1-1 TaxID=2804559 RepID=UPI003CF8E8E1
MSEAPVTDWQILRHCARWDYRCYPDGPLAHVLMHVVVDPRALLGHGTHGTARASVRLILRDGTAWGAVVTAPRSALDEMMGIGDIAGIAGLAGTVLAGQRYDEAAFKERDAALAAALLDAGQGAASIALEHRAGMLPRPLLTSAQMCRLVWCAVQRADGEAGEAAAGPALRASMDRACSTDDPAVLAYRAALDAHALAYGATAPAAHGMEPDRLEVYNFIAASSGNARNRAQAMATLPWLLPMLTSHASGTSLAEAPGILAAIDAGLPLHDAVARTFGVPREVVRWTARRSLPAHWLVDPGRLRRLLALLSWLPPERRPQTLAAFGQLTARAGALTAPLEFIASEDGPEALHRLAPCMRRWLAQGQPDEVAGSASDLRDAKDFLAALFEARQRLDGQDAAAADATVLAWCASIRVARLLTLSRAWHAAIAAQSPAAQGSDSMAHWPAVLASPWQFEARTIVELTSSAQLRREGQVMSHCVASYAALCHSGNSVIVSMATLSGVPMSTAQLHLHDHLPLVCAGQHRAASNAAPGAACVRALQALLHHLNGAGEQHLLLRRRQFQREQDTQRSLGRGAPRFNDFSQRAARQLGSQAARFSWPERGSMAGTREQGCITRTY